MPPPSEANPATIAFGMLMLLFFVTSAWAWLGVFLWLAQKGKGPPVEPRVFARWGLVDLLITIALYVGSNLVILGLGAIILKRLQLLPAEGEPNYESSRMMAMFVLGGLAQLITMALATVAIAVRTGSSFADLGWNTRRVGYDILLGLGASVLFIPGTQVLMVVLSLTTGVEYDHPLFLALQSGPVLWMYLAVFFAAVIVAPITEEFLFRVLLQGYLERLSVQQFSLELFCFGSSTELVTLNEKSELDPPILMESGYKPTTPRTCSYIPIWPTLLSGLLFGLAHFEYGVSWVPLVVLGVALGLLYRLTHRIGPCWIVHTVLNGITLTGLGIQLMTGGPDALKKPAPTKPQTENVQTDKTQTENKQKAKEQTTVVEKPSAN